MPGRAMKGAVPAAVVLAVLSTISGLVTTLAGGAQKPDDELRFYMPRDEMERRMGALERKLDGKFYELRELIIRRTK